MCLEIKKIILDQKDTPTQVFSCEFCKIFQNIFFVEHLHVNSSVVGRNFSLASQKVQLLGPFLFDVFLFDLFLEHDSHFLTNFTDNTTPYVICDTTEVLTSLTNIA